MRALVKLTRNGTSSAVTIPKQMLVYLGWLTGESFIVTVTERGDLTVRRPCADDFGPNTPASYFPRTPATSAK